jgi:excinuclease UvrABC ATPase subunit
MHGISNLFFILGRTKFYEGKCWIFRNTLFVKLKVSKQINYSTKMCQSCQGTTTVVETKKSLVLSFRQKSLREDLIVWFSAFQK